MFTRCPQCRTVYPLTASSISHARGLIQCEQCDQTFNALNFLFDDLPSGQAYEPAKKPNTEPPLPEAVSNTNKAGDNTPSDATDTGEFTSKPHRLAWGLATALLVLLTTANTAWTFREPLLENPAISTWLQQAGWLRMEQNELLKDPQQLQLVSRDIHSHPTRSDILVLSITFVNLAQHKQAFPELELTLLDATNQPVARRQLQPVDYLHPGVDTRTGLAPDVYLPVLLELRDPGKQAVGFEIRFL